MTTSEEFARRHYRYGRLHHEKRLVDFASPANDFERRLVKQSQVLIAGPEIALWGSVDLDDAEYLKELDEFEGL